MATKCSLCKMFTPEPPHNHKTIKLDRLNINIYITSEDKNSSQILLCDKCFNSLIYKIQNNINEPEWKKYLMRYHCFLSQNIINTATNMLCRETNTDYESSLKIVMEFINTINDSNI